MGAFLSLIEPLTSEIAFTVTYTLFFFAKYSVCSA